jgi:MFS family permease
MVALFLPHDPSVDQESAPLLPPSALQASLAHPTPKKKKNPKGKEKKPWRLLVALTILLIAIFNLGGFLAEPPKIRVYEANLCVHYYEKNDVSKIRSDGTVDEALCKENEIQQKVAMIFGWQDMFDAIPGILLAVLFGTLADKWGRKWILTTALMGLQLGMAWVLFVCTCVRWRKVGSGKAHRLRRLLQNSSSPTGMALLRFLSHWGRPQCCFGYWGDNGVGHCASRETSFCIRLPYCERTCR